MLAGLILGAFLINAFATPAILSLAHRNKWYDQQNHRTIHTDDIPRLGGVGIYVSFVTSSIIGLAVVRSQGLLLPESVPTIVSVLVGISVIHFTGLYDDFVNLKALVKLLFQVCAAIVVVAGGAFFRQIDLPFFSFTIAPVVGVPLTILWIVSISNAVNLVDGADGLAGSISASAALFMGLIALSRGNVGLAVVAFALLGSVAGFLVFNFPPARIFMGDSGSLLLGCVLAVIPVIGFTPGNHAFSVLPVLTLLLVPILDTLLAIGRRVTRHTPVHAADREHLHHRLIDRGIAGSRLVGIVVVAMGILGATAMLWFTTAETIATIATGVVWSSALVGSAVIKQPS